MATYELQVFDSQALPWEERFIPELGKALFAKRFLEDPDTGVTVRLVKYPPASPMRGTPIPAPTACSCWRARW
ncbi:MAG TPA: hypothetical protein VK515_10745 [Rhizomicrobium sp.]|nr:hypothetical protein [Rhizomicrobium sp.]